MIDRTVKRLLLSKLKITKQALSQRAKKLKAAYGPMSTEEAIYVIAHQQGIDLSRFLSIELIDRVRSLVPKELPKTTKPQPSRKKNKSKRKSFTSSYPLVPNNMLLRSVAIGTESFPQIFGLENSIRHLIMKKLTAAYGSRWWSRAVSKGIRESVQRTIDREKKYPHREKRGLHPIYYSNFADLKEIIVQNRKVFANPIIDFKWFEVEMDQVYMARNSLAHSILITEDDALTIRLFYRNWARLLETEGYK